MTGFILSPAADADIDALAEYIATTQSLAAAERFIDAIYEKCALLARHPDVGRLRPDLPHASVPFPPARLWCSIVTRGAASK